MLSSLSFYELKAGLSETNTKGVNEKREWNTLKLTIGVRKFVNFYTVNIEHGNGK